MPLELKSDCKEDTVLEFLLTSVDSQETASRLKLEIERDDHEECDCDVNAGISDSCLFGKWELVHSTVESLLTKWMSMGPGQLLSVKSSGLQTVEVTRDGKFLTTAAPWEVEAKRKQTDGDVIEFKTTNVGQYISKVGAGKGILCSETISSTMTAQMTITKRGRSQTIPTNATSNGLPFYMTYECEGDRLIYKEAFGVGPGGSNMTFNYEWKRIH